MVLDFNSKTSFLRVDRAYHPLNINRIVIELDGKYYLARYYFHDDIPGTGNNKLQSVPFTAPQANWDPFDESEYWVYQLEHKRVVKEA